MNVMANINELNENSDLMLAIKIAKEKRDERITDLADKLSEGATKKEYLHDFVDGIVSMNENIKVMEDAVIAVSVYRANNK